MTRDDSDLLVHDVIGRLFEEPEPMHRTDLADGAIAQGMAASRRRGFAVAGATLSVLAVVAGAVTVAGGVRGSGSGDWSLGTDSGKVSGGAYESDAPTYADRQREVVEQLPGALRPLLPAGVTIQDVPRPGAIIDMPTGDFEPEFTLRWHGIDCYLQLDPSGRNATDVLDKAGAKPVAVAGGSIRTAPGHGMTWYEYAPSDLAAPKIYFMIYSSVQGTAGPIDAAAFQQMVQAPGFAKVRQLLDPSVPASAAAVRERYAIEAKINAEAAKVLPPGFRLKLNPGTPLGFELVGPNGVNTFQWYAIPDDTRAVDCPVGSLCYRAPGANGKVTQAHPDGKGRFGTYLYGAGTAPDPLFSLEVGGVPKAGDTTGGVEPGKPVETAPQGPGLTPQQAMAIVRAPGLAKVITDVQKLVALS
ncbi:hypothetical protein KGQ19_39270 [Catenulispora sp. NL8]|uniref:Uncharacterized protein n=1 Tax=Catenulispora pinistramenti TaxID=2705254 RepID=A0ABS5L3J0_9ACTN|nr:hypothetical protein [Catenulispora pinistramenti]MBS2552911.1 hypothetical protein [Catenulispora pinistramenti]